MRVLSEMSSSAYWIDDRGPSDNPRWPPPRAARAPSNTARKRVLRHGHVAAGGVGRLSATCDAWARDEVGRKRGHPGNVMRKPFGPSQWRVLSRVQGDLSSGK
jgi:hypothetical protein